MRQKLKGRGHQPGARERCVLRKRRPVADRRYVVEVAAVDPRPDHGQISKLSGRQAKNGVFA